MRFEFTFLGTLGSGGNGDLFKALRHDTGETVIVKFLREYHLQYARRTFAREVSILSRGLPGMVPLLDSDVKATRPYYVMPFFAAGTLTPYGGKLSRDQLLAVASQLALTLCNLHSARIWHGDVKPDNVYVSDDGNIKVGDPLGNGIGCTIIFSVNRGGTPGYWAPEIRAGGQISQAGDVYSFGATLYELLTGRKPEDGQSLDPASEGYASRPRICEVIGACCQIASNARPTMREVLRMLRGESWVAIRTEREKRQELMNTTALVVGGALLVAALRAQRPSR